MSRNIYMKYGLYNGPVTAPDKYKGWIELETISWGASNAASFSYGGGGSTGKVVTQDIHFTKVIDGSISYLFFHCSKGEHTKKVTIDFVKDAEGKSYFSVELEDVMVSTITWSDHAGGGSLAQEQASLSFTGINYSYKPTTASNDPKHAIEKANWRSIIARLA